MIEVVVSIIIASTAVLGLGYFFIEAAESMRISWQIRDMEEYGYYYTDQFREKVRNGYRAELVRMNPPSELKIYYTDPFDVYQKESEYQFEYDNRSRIPVIRRDGVVLEYPNFPPPSPSGRDEIYIDSRSFKIYEDDRSAPAGIQPSTYNGFRSTYYNIEFTMYYRRYPAVSVRGIYEKELQFSTGAYIGNSKWVAIADTSSSSNDD